MTVHLDAFRALLALPPTCADDLKARHVLTQPGDPKRHRTALIDYARANVLSILIEQPGGSACKLVSTARKLTPKLGARPLREGCAGSLSSDPQPCAGDRRAPIVFERERKRA
jgi:hypothetical protein